jgi:hypothetical protein
VEDARPQASAPTGLGGWLTLVGIGLVISMILQVRVFVFTLLPLFSNGSFARISQPASEYYYPALAMLVFIEVAINLALIGFTVWIMVLFLARSRLFPRMYIALLSASIVFLLADVAALHFILPDQPSFDAETTKTLVQACIAACIWIPYMLYSVRVKNTFVRTQVW